MTKKPSEKNKAWEKDRRDRLNKTFDELAKLLPQFDQSVVWSKIEIIQKAITFIKELQKKHETYLKAKDPELLKDYKEFANCLKFYQKRNAQLTELLIKANVSLPPVVLPQLLTDKPELLPNNAESSIVRKPKRSNITSKKSGSQSKKTEQKKGFKTETGNLQPQTSATPADTVVTAAVTSKIYNETLINANGSLAETCSVQVKPLLLRVTKIIKKRKLNRKPMFRKCYPHPDKMPSWKMDPVSLREIRSKQSRRLKRKLKKKQPKQTDIEANPVTGREHLVSPTAAFLHSFPVVTSLNGKNVDNAESSVSLENLNNFFTSEEYSKFCDQSHDTDEKMLTSICTPPEESGGKPLISGKPMTSFTVSAITRPISPKKEVTPCQQGRSKRQRELSCVTECKPGRRTTLAPFESFCNFTNINAGPNSQKATCTEQISNPAVVSCFPSSTAHLKSLAKEDHTATNSYQSKSISTVKFLSDCTNRSPSKPNVMAETNLRSEKPIVECSAMLSDVLQSQFISTDLPTTMDWPKSVTHNKSMTPIPTSDAYAIKNGSQNLRAIELKPLSVISTDAISKPVSKSSVLSFYSPTKSFFHDFSLPTPIKSFNFNLPPTTSSKSDPLISSPISAKAHSLFSFPSMKSEFPWLNPNTTSSPLTPALTTTSVSTCSLNFPPLDLPSITCEPLTSTSFTFSFSTSKSFEPNVVETENKLNSTNRFNQMNLFIPYEEVQCATMPTTTPKKSSKIQANSTANWKLEKVKDITNQFFYDCEQSKPQPKSLVNWMTSPTTEYTPASNAMQPAMDFVNQFPTSTNNDFGFGCRKDTYDEDNHFINWSPLKTDFCTPYSFENFGSNEAPPNKTIKQIFSVSQLVDQTPAQEVSPAKKLGPKTVPQKSTPAKQAFSNTYSAESLIAKKDNPRVTNATTFYNTDISSTQSDYHGMNNYFYNYPTAPNCSQTENDYLGANSYSAPTTAKTTSNLPSAGETASTTAIAPFDSTSSSTNTYFGQTNSASTNDPYDPMYFPSSNYNQSITSNWNHSTRTASINSFNHSPLPFAGIYGSLDSSCQQSTNGSSNLTNFNLSSICPEIDGKEDANGW